MALGRSVAQLGDEHVSTGGRANGSLRLQAQQVEQFRRSPRTGERAAAVLGLESGLCGEVILRAFVTVPHHVHQLRHGDRPVGLDGERIAIHRGISRELQSQGRSHQAQRAPFAERIAPIPGAAINLVPEESAFPASRSPTLPPRKRCWLKPGNGRDRSGPRRRSGCGWRCNRPRHPESAGRTTPRRAGHCPASNPYPGRRSPSATPRGHRRSAAPRRHRAPGNTGSHTPRSWPRSTGSASRAVFARSRPLAMSDVVQWLLLGPTRPLSQANPSRMGRNSMAMLTPYSFRPPVVMLSRFPARMRLR